MSQEWDDECQGRVVDDLFFEAALGLVFGDVHGVLLGHFQVMVVGALTHT